MYASQEVPIGSVLCKPAGLKRVGSRGWSQGRPGWTFIHAPGYDSLASLVISLLEIRWPTSFGFLCHFIALVLLWLAVKIPSFQIKNAFVIHVRRFVM